jgi:hypothetical protein
MPRPLSPTAMRSIMSEVTNEAFILLVTMRHDDTNETFRCCLNTETIISQGQEFIPTFFEITLPETLATRPRRAARSQSTTWTDAWWTCCAASRAR